MSNLVTLAAKVRRFQAALAGVVRASVKGIIGSTHGHTRRERGMRVLITGGAGFIGCTWARPSWPAAIPWLR